jgi:hypothetical protein
MKVRTVISLFFLIFSTIILSYCHHLFLNIDLLQINQFSKTLTKAQIDQVLSLETNNEFLNLIAISLCILAKVILISIIIFIGSFLFHKNFSIKKIILIVVKSEYIFILPILFEIIYFKFINTTASLIEIQNFYPLSAINILGYKGLEPWLIYPLQILNLFEIAYIIYLAYQIGKVTNTNTDTGFKIMMYSYVPTMLLWVCVVMFLTLSMS